MKWYAPVFISIVIEGLVNYARKLVVRKKFQWRRFATMALGIACAMVFQVDLFAIAGIPAAIPYVGEILTGIMLSRGPSYIYKLIGQFDKAKNWVEGLVLARQSGTGDVENVNEEDESAVDMETRNETPEAEADVNEAQG